MAKQWTGWGERRSKEYYRLRKQIRLRDPYCIRCFTLEGIINGARLECDHFIPVSQGGADSPSNLWMLCHECHIVKSLRETSGATGWPQAIGVDGWTMKEPDWLKIISERNP